MFDAVLLPELVRSAAIGGIVSACIALALVLTRHLHLTFTGDPEGAAHKIHAVRTCRVGGVAVLAGFVAAFVHWTWWSGSRAAPDPGFATLLLLALVPVAGSGFVEDLTKHVNARQRMFWIALGAAIVTAGGATWLGSVGVAPLDVLLAWSPFAFAFTVVACTGATNAFNIVDGLDGLLAGIALLTLAAIAAVAARVGDTTVLGTTVLLAVAIAAWLPFNWPRARLFSGDGGAYAVGFVVSVLLLMLVQRNPQVSPWFGLTAAALPVWETLYSMWRRRSSGRATMAADQGHLHQLVRARLLRSIEERASRPAGDWADEVAPVDAYAAAVAPGAINGACSPILWALHAAVVLPGVFWFDDTAASTLLFATFATSYVLLHRRLTRQPVKSDLALAR